MSSRRCENWLLKYRDYIQPRTDAPESFVYWSGLFALSSAIRKKVWFPRKYLGLWDCYPHMYLMFVGPAGMRKTTAIENGAMELLRLVPNLSGGPDMFTKEVILDKMQRSPDSSMHLVVGEFSDIFQKTRGPERGGMYEFLTSMYDNRPTLEAGTKTQGTVILEKPCLNFFSATTPEWITEHMPEGVIGGGFASRCLWIYEDKLRIEKMLFDDVVGPFAEMEKDLVLDLIHIADTLEGEFTLTPDGREVMTEWTQAAAPQFLSKNPKLGGYINRRKMHVLKLAMLHSISKKNDLTLDALDWSFGVHSVSTFEPNLEKVFGGIGKNRFTVDMDKIVTYVKNMNIFTNKAVSESQIKDDLRSIAEPRMFNDLLRYIVEAKLLIMSDNGEQSWFKHPDFKEIKT